ncbi:unnamed protein product [Bursaphelenchus xylophilus]|uniref:(pine wood nematode) hypothetical protein n=1 Tax=Bursaphelenchus xylophilus TaxID=6326 RepID=A0A1I7SQH0_BURXY|nr:unnamed protein product [Bursaphelenchus xylophilus]CAG9109888.1 unnamed protein product [Bursaphelenchus xylophilus]
MAKRIWLTTNQGTEIGKDIKMSSNLVSKAGTFPNTSLPQSDQISTPTSATAPVLPGTPIRILKENTELLDLNGSDSLRPDESFASDSKRLDRTSSQLSSYMELNADILETASIVTSASEDEFRSQVAYLESQAQIEDDVFHGKVTVAVAEEAIFVEENMTVNRETSRYLSQVVNVFEIQLNDIQAVVQVEDGDVKANGYVTSVGLQERFKIRFGDVIREKSKLRATSPIPEYRLLDTNVLFNLQAHEGFTSLKIDVKELEIAISDIILSHLGPFFQVEQEEDEKFQLHLDLSDSRIQIKDSKKKNPLRITLGRLAIDDRAISEQNE